ncbi:mesothelin-like protein [Rhinoraja longicauda]
MALFWSLGELGLVMSESGRCSWDAGALEFSSCPQSVKNLLYDQAVLALSSEQNKPIPYYQLVKAYLGGAATDDLRFLAINEVNMEFAIFKNLNPEEVQNLTAQNIIDLLGFNLQALRDGVNETVVMLWVASNTESEVRKLGLKGGIPSGNCLRNSREHLQ